MSLLTDQKLDLLARLVRREGPVRSERDQVLIDALKLLTAAKRKLEGLVQR